MNYIKHHGILGQKWGVRRFQYDDGSLTKAGENRYYGNSKKVSSSGSISKSINSAKSKVENAAKAKNSSGYISKSINSAKSKVENAVKAKGSLSSVSNSINSAKDKIEKAKNQKEREDFFTRLGHGPSPGLTTAEDIRARLIRAQQYYYEDGAMLADEYEVQKAVIEFLKKTDIDVDKLLKLKSKKDLEDFIDSIVGEEGDMEIPNVYYPGLDYVNKKPATVRQIVENAITKMNHYPTSYGLKSSNEQKGEDVVSDILNKVGNLFASVFSGGK